ncbi:MAG TPA: TetR/AcrR family transcriptional regulator [Thermoanaerobaculia bacterium]|nr:TetR/AcrR family transcriptional regulator [Thermoanaerobaculia bacterium]
MVQTPRPVRAQENGAKVLERKRAILEAASRVFLRKGIHATGMRDIAAELGMAVGSLYYYFEDKEELLAFVQEDALAGLLELAEEVRGLELTADARLFRLIAGHVVRLNDLAEGTPGSLAHLELEHLRPARRAVLLAQRDRYEQHLRELIEEGVGEAIFRPTDPKVAALTILGAINWTVRWFRPEGGKSAHQIGQESAELLVRGLLAPGTELTATEERP